MSRRQLIAPSSKRYINDISPFSSAAIFRLLHHSDCPRIEHLITRQSFRHCQLLSLEPPLFSNSYRILSLLTFSSLTFSHPLSTPLSRSIVFPLNFDSGRIPEHKANSSLLVHQAPARRSTSSVWQLNLSPSQSFPSSFDRVGPKTSSVEPQEFTKHFTKHLPDIDIKFLAT